MADVKVFTNWSGGMDRKQMQIVLLLFISS